MNQDLEVEATDSRRIAFFMTDNALFDSGIAAEIGTSATVVYQYLLRKANKSSECWPSRLGIMKATGLGRDTVTAAVEILQARAMIRRTDDGDRYRFVILDKEEWRLPETDRAKKSPTMTGRKNRPTGRKNRPTGRKNRLEPGEKIAPKNTHETIPKEENTKGEQEPLALESLPEKLPGNLTRQTWDDFKDARKAMKAKMTDRAEKLLLRALTEFVKQGEDAEKVVEQSIMKSWRGLFPVKDHDEKSREWKPGRPIYIDGVRVPDHQCDEQTGWVSPEFGRSP